MSELVSDNQGRETARMARNVGVPRQRYQVALTDGTMQQVLCALRDALPITVGIPLEYPSWVREHLTPELEATGLRNPGEVELWFDPRQKTGNPYPTGHEVYTALKAANFLERSLSYGDLRFFEENPDQIPTEFRGKWIYGWASVVRSVDGGLNVPYLICNVDRPYVDWNWLVIQWSVREPAGLRK